MGFEEARREDTTSIQIGGTNEILPNCALSDIYFNPFYSVLLQSILFYLLEYCPSTVLWGYVSVHSTPLLLANPVTARGLPAVARALLWPSAVNMMRHSEHAGSTAFWDR